MIMITSNKLTSDAAGVGVVVVVIRGTVQPVEDESIIIIQWLQLLFLLVVVVMMMVSRSLSMTTSNDIMVGSIQDGIDAKFVVRCCWFCCCCLGFAGG